MVSNGDSAAALLASQPPTPIAQLSPDLPDQSSRVVRGEVTITWPFNSVKKTLAFLIAEPDVRLRRAKGQIRIELRGPSAIAASDCGLGAGDELLFSLDGAEWEKDVSPGRIPGARVEWQLQFSQRLVLRVKSGESGEIKHVNIDSPAQEQPDEPAIATQRPLSPEPEPGVADIPSTVRKISDLPPGEYPSPAFVKRARLSYGALFEGGFDIFEEDGGVRGKGRKRTRFGRDSSAWRYTSQSPSPEPSTPVPDSLETAEDATSQPSPKPRTMDEGCQTSDVEMEEAAPESVAPAAPPRDSSPAPQESPTPAPRKGPSAPAQADQVVFQETQGATLPLPPRDKPAAPIQTRETTAPAGEPDSAATSVEASVGTSEQPVTRSPQEQNRGQQPETGPQATPAPTSNAEAATGSLFSPKSFGSSFSSFGAGAPDRVESTLSLADQVRFGFSHVPQTTHAPSPRKPEQTAEPEPGPHRDAQDSYPVSYLDAPAPAKYADVDTYISVADAQDEMAVQRRDVPKPPVLERYNEGQWEMPTQAPHYNPIEGGHFGVNALEEGAGRAAGQTSLHASDVGPGQVPEGFASYGAEDTSDKPRASPPRQALSQYDQPLVENEDTITDDGVGVEDDEDEDAEADEYAYGERIGEGDYDQRNYNLPSDDDDGLSEEEEEVGLEAEERYGNNLVYDEDGDEEDYGSEEYGSGEDYGDEEDYEDEDEEDYDAAAYQHRTPAAPPPAGEPVVISLLSDSEDDAEPDEPAPAPIKPEPSFQAADAPEPRTSPETPPTLDRQPSPEVRETMESEREKAHEPNRASPAAPDEADRQASPDIQETVETDNEKANEPDRSSPGPHGLDRQASLDIRENMESESGKATERDVKSPTPPPQLDRQPSRDIRETVETESEKMSAPDRIFGTTHVVDFAMRAVEAGSMRPAVPPIDMSADLQSFWDTNQASSSFQESSIRHEPNLPDPEPVPSESSSEGLFVAPPRGRSPDAMSTSRDDASTDAGDGIDEVPTDAGQALEPQQREGSTEPMEVEAMERDESMADDSEAQKEDDSLPDADRLSFSSQIEMDEELIETVVEETAEPPVEEMPVEDGEKHSGAADASSGAVDNLETTRPEAQESLGEDVDMVDVGPAQLDTAPSEVTSPSPREVTTMEVSVTVSEVVVTEVISEAAVGAPADEVHLNAQVPAQKEADVLPPAAKEGASPAAEPGGDTEDMHAGRITSPDGDTERQTEGTQMSDSLIPASQAQAGLADHEPAEARPGDGKGLQGTQPVSIRDEPATPADAPADTKIPDSPQPPTVVRLDQAEPDGQTAPADQSAAQQPASPAAEEPDDNALLLEQLSQEHQQALDAEAAKAHARSRSSSPDISVALAREAVAAKRNKKPAEPTRTSSRVTRARSSSLLSNTTTGTPEKDEDSSVSLARAALASPSKRGAEVDGAGPTPAASTTVTALKAELTRRLRIELPECVPLKTLTSHVDKSPNAVAVVTSQPTQPARAKGGPREYFMSFHAADPSVAPSKVVEVQLYRPHKDSLPVVKPGDVVLLQRFQVKAISKKGWGLRTGMESAWAVWEAGDGAGQTTAPQIRGPPVEDWEKYVGYVGTLRTWFGLLMADGPARGRLERANRKLAGAAGGGK